MAPKWRSNARSPTSFSCVPWKGGNDITLPEVRQRRRADVAERSLVPRAGGAAVASDQGTKGANRMKTMKAVVFKGKDSIAVEDVPMPRPHAGEAVIKIT